MAVEWTGDLACQAGMWPGRVAADTAVGVWCAWDPAESGGVSRVAAAKTLGRLGSSLSGPQFKWTFGSCGICSMDLRGFAGVPCRLLALREVCSQDGVTVQGVS